MHAIAYLTAELKSRDLDSRLLIAAHLVKAGIPAVVGHQWGMFMSRDVAWKGCYVFKTANSIQTREMANSAASGHLVVASDEEALALVGSMAIRNVDAGALRHSHLFLTQNEQHKSLLSERFPDATATLTVTGNVRIDLLTEMKKNALREAESIRAQVGPYILFNTGFALTNSVWGDTQTTLDALQKAQTIDLQGEAGQRELQQRLAAEEWAKTEILKLLLRCADSTPGHRMVVRPHPAENVERWKTVIAGREDRILIVSGTTAAPWLLGASAMVHADSTVGVEAALLNVPCVNLSPPGPWGDNFVMRSINPTVSTADEAFVAMTQQLENKATAAALPAIIAQRFPAHAAQNVAREIVGLMERHGASRTYPSNFPWRTVALPPLAKEKFSVSADEFNARASAIFSSLGMTRHEPRQIDEGLFLIRPIGGNTKGRANTRNR